LPVLLAGIAEKVDTFPEPRDQSAVDFKSGGCFGFTLRATRNDNRHFYLLFSAGECHSRI